MGISLNIESKLNTTKEENREDIEHFRLSTRCGNCCRKAATDDKTVQVAESADQLTEEQRYGGYRGGYGGSRGGYGGSRGGYGGRRYGRSVADETQELEVEE